MRIRTVKPDFWMHPVMSALPDHVQLIALGILNVADDEGFFHGEVNLIRAQIAPRRESVTVHGALAELSRIGYLEFRETPEKTLVGRVVKFLNHQRINRPTVSSLAPLWDSLSPHCLLTEGSRVEGREGRKGKEGKGTEGKKEGILNPNTEEIPPFIPPKGDKKRENHSNAVRAWSRVRSIASGECGTLEPRDREALKAIGSLYDLGKTDVKMMPAIRKAFIESYKAIEGK